MTTYLYLPFGVTAQRGGWVAYTYPLIVIAAMISYTPSFSDPTCCTSRRPYVLYLIPNFLC
ncbi:hypothetical protein OG21DRAFT_539952 [Imleria badia]|nr:hypothetical protein OG21DRAFT_539952 [Imleria badia]